MDSSPLLYLDGLAGLDADCGAMQASRSIPLVSRRALHVPSAARNQEIRRLRFSMPCMVFVRENSIELFRQVSSGRRPWDLMPSTGTLMRQRQACLGWDQV